MNSFSLGFGCGLASTLGGFNGFGFGGFGLGGFGFGGCGIGRTVDPIFTCYADLDSRLGMSSWVPAYNIPLQEGFTFPLELSTLSFCC